MNWQGNGNWPLLVGEICGCLLGKLDFISILDKDGYTNQIQINRQSGEYLITVTPKNVKPTTFVNLDIGDMFNTKAWRAVKTSEDEALIVMSSIAEAGQFITVLADTPVIPIYQATK